MSKNVHFGLIRVLYNYNFITMILRTRCWRKWRYRRAKLERPDEEGSKPGPRGRRTSGGKRYARVETENIRRGQGQFRQEDKFVHERTAGRTTHFQTEGPTAPGLQRQPDSDRYWRDRVRKNDANYAIFGRRGLRHQGANWMHSGIVLRMFINFRPS